MRPVVSVNDRVGRSRRILSGTLDRSRNLNKPNFTELSKADLKNLFELIDDEYFGGAVSADLKELKFPLEFRVSRRMTSSGGITTTKVPANRRRQKEFEIAISSTLLFESFRDTTPILVTGVVCENRFQALQRIMEHEMIHLIEMLLWHDSNCAAGRFRRIARRHFGHRQSTHQLITPSDTALRKHKIAVGDWVSFEHENRRMIGFVNRITKRATVLVPSRQGTPYTDGKSYAKYYVPIQHLVRAA